MSRYLPLLLPLVVAVSAAVPGSAAGEDPVVAQLKNPTATGLLVTRVYPDTQAEELGLVPGMILTSYGGKPMRTVEELAAAKQALSGEEAIEVGLHHAGKDSKVSMRPGQLGVDLTPVTKGSPIAPLPPATDVEFDFSSLRDAPREAWYAFHLADGPRCGFEHHLLRLDGETLVLKSEVAFDGGERWGKNHFLVEVTSRVGTPPMPRKTRFENTGTGWVGEGVLERHEDGTLEWRLNTRMGEETTAQGTPIPADTMAMYMVAQLAPFMPRVPGACLHFRPLGEGMGTVGLPTALVCIGEEEIDLGDGTTAAWRYEQHRIGGVVVSKYWVDQGGRLVRVDYGGAINTISTREAAVKDLPAELRPAGSRE
jgi:hypothetical protein